MNLSQNKADRELGGKLAYATTGAIIRAYKYRILSSLSFKYKKNTVKPAHAVTSIKQSPVLSRHLY
jgi:hypothetical protein